MSSRGDGVVTGVTKGALAGTLTELRVWSGRNLLEEQHASGEGSGGQSTWPCEASGKRETDSKCRI